MIVADTNLLMYFWVPGSENEYAEAVLKKDPAWITVPLWISEFRNAVTRHIRSGDLTAAIALEIILKAENMMQNNVYTVSSAQVMKHVGNSTCSAYDCEYIALAKQFDCPLITADKKLIRSFPDTALHYHDFIDSVV